MADKCSDELRMPDHDDGTEQVYSSRPLMPIYFGIIPRNPLPHPIPTNLTPIIGEVKNCTSGTAG